MQTNRILSGVLLGILVCGCDNHFFVEEPLRIPPYPTDPSGFITQLEDAYRRRSYDLYARLFSDDAEAPFLFIPCEPLLGGLPHWGRGEELRFHRRMFQPENPLAGETPVPQELWIHAITIKLTPVGTWIERTDLYRSSSDSTGLDPARWRATEAQYRAEILCDTQTDTDYHVDGRENFTVIEDLARAEGEEGKFLLYRWEDLCGYAALPDDEGTTWSALKRLYSY